jgi:serine protease Do
MSEGRRLLLVAALAGAVGGGATIMFFGPHPGSRAQDHAPATERKETAATRAELERTLAGLKDASSAFKQVAKLVSPSVVHIMRERTATAEPDPLEEMFDRFFRGREGTPRPSFKERAYGSGVIVSADGLVLTNNHVAGGGGRLAVKLQDGRELPAKLIGADPRTDVAVIKLEGSSFTPAELGDSDALEVGDWVLAFGNPFGLEQTVTAGIISAKRRSKVGVADYEDFLQTDAAINPGNSGGPLVDISGRIVGINTAIASRSGGYQGIGFAIPVNMARAIMDSLVKAGHVVRGFLGVGAQDASPELSERLGLGRRAGALVASVVPGSPAAKAGIRELDLIVAIDGQPIDDSTRLRLVAAGLPVGKTVDVKVVREGKELVLPVTIVERSDEGASAAPAAPEEPAPAAPATVGITAQPLTATTAKRLGIAPDDGVLVVEVAPGSLAAQAGIQPGMVIQEIDRKKITALEDLEAAIAKIDARKGVLLKVWNGRAASYLLLKAQ